LVTSTAPVLDNRPHAEAIKAAITAQLGTKVVDGETVPLWQAYDYDEVPGGADTADANVRAQPLPHIYVVVAVERRFAPAQRPTGAGRSSWRVTAVPVGRTVDEARWAMLRDERALDEARLVIADSDTEHTTSPLTLELASQPEPDDGRFSGRVQYTYAL
jgi:hypothetical protein